MVCTKNLAIKRQEEKGEGRKNYDSSLRYQVDENMEPKGPDYSSLKISRKS